MIIGIDVGNSGAMAAINNGELVYCKKFPTYKTKVGKKNKTVIDEHALVDEFVYLRANYRSIEVYLEKVSAMPGQGVTSMFTFGESFGLLKGMLRAMRLPYTLVTPQKWQAAVLGKGDDRMDEYDYCSARWPTQDWRATPRSKKPFSGMLDAACIAMFGEMQG